MPYWLTRGLGLEREGRLCVQKGCREIVKQIVCGAKEYWLTDFSDKRAERTHAMLQNVLRKCGVDETVMKRVEVLVEEGGESRINDGTGWLLVVITKELLENSLAGSPPLSPAIKGPLARAWAEVTNTDFEKLDFEELCLASTSLWDTYTRSLTPDLPTLLADFVKLTAMRRDFDLLWTAINAHLSEDQRRELVDWYRVVGQSMTGEPLELPPNL